MRASYTSESDSFQHPLGDDAFQEDVENFDSLLGDIGPSTNVVPLRPSNLAVALRLAEAGIAVFPCGPDKRPLVKAWPIAATTDARHIRRWWRQHPDALPGLPCGERNRIAVLDVDRREDGRDGEAALNAIGLDPASLSRVRIPTPSGGMHVYFQWQDGLTNEATHLPTGVDVRGQGGFVIAPGTTLPDGRTYGDADLSQPLPAWPAFLMPPEREPNFEHLLGGADPVDWQRVDAALKAISPNCDRADWTKVGMALHAADEGDEGFERWNRWSAGSSTKYIEREMPGQWKSFGRKSGIGIGTLFRIAAEHGWSDPAHEVDVESAFEEEPLPPALPAVDAKIVKGKSGAPLATLSNAVTFTLKIDRERGLDLRHDLMSGDLTSKEGAVTDSLVDRLRMAVERSGMPNASNDLMQRAVSEVARRNAYHPVRDYLASLRWDGRTRLRNLLSDYFGSDDTPYTRAIGRATLIAMVARVMEPGCKHDHALILIGAQGIGKSTACRILACQDRWFSDSLPRIHGDSKEARLHLRGRWIVELGELSSMSKAEVEDAKAFITTAVDKVRIPYARRDESLARQCVFIGTTNREEFLRDETGGRRFWPVCARKIELAALARDRDQLFAEALAAYRAGEIWHLPPEVEALARSEQAKAREPDAWEEAIREWLDADGFDAEPKNAVRVSDVLRSCIGVPLDRQTPRETRRVGAVMRVIGWLKTKDWKGNIVWHRPTTDHGPSTDHERNADGP